MANCIFDSNYANMAGQISHVYAKHCTRGISWDMQVPCAVQPYVCMWPTVLTTGLTGSSNYANPMNRCDEPPPPPPPAPPSPPSPPSPPPPSSP
eukprot:6786492-Prymnesium_polylepis.1